MTFQSKVNDPDEFNDNLKKLDSIISLNKEMENTYSHLDLRYNYINLFLENGIPQIGFTIDNNEVKKLKGTSVEGQVSPKYFSILQQKIRNYDIDNETYESIIKTVSAVKEIQHFKDKLGKPIEEASSLELLDAAGMVEKSNDENGEIILSRYGQPSKNFTWTDLNVDENKFFESVVYIDHDADFSNSNADNLGILKVIHGNANFENSNIKSLGELTKINGSANFHFSKIENLSNLNYIGRDANFLGTNIKNLGNLEYINGSVDFRLTKLKDLGNLKFIGKDAWFVSSDIKNMGNIEEIQGRVHLKSGKYIDHYQRNHSVTAIVKSCFNSIIDLCKSE